MATSSPIMLFLAVLLTVGVVSIAGVALMLFTGQTGIGGGDDASVTLTQEVASATEEGKSATLQFKANNQVSDTKAQVASSLYVVEFNGDGVRRLLDDVTTLSATALTSTSSTVGKKIFGCYFDGSYYGDCGEEANTFTVTDRIMTVPLKVYDIATTNPNVTFDDEDATTGTSDNVGNITLSSSQTGTIDSIEFENRDADDQLRIRGLGLDLVATGTNISDITISGVEYVKCEPPKTNCQVVQAIISEPAMPKRLQNTLDYYFQFDDNGKPLTLDEFQSLTVKVMQITHDCDTAANEELIDLYWLDESCFRSNKDPEQVKCGVEDDQPSEADVGASDFSYTTGEYGRIEVQGSGS